MSHCSRAWRGPAPGSVWSPPGRRSRNSPTCAPAAPPELALTHLDEGSGADLLDLAASQDADRERNGAPSANGHGAADPRHCCTEYAERREVARAVADHALSLQLLRGYIHDALGELRRWQEVDLGNADEAQGGHAGRVLAVYEA